VINYIACKACISVPRCATINLLADGGGGVNLESDNYLEGALQCLFCENDLPWPQKCMGLDCRSGTICPH